MKLIRTSSRLSLVALAVIASSCALAQDTGWYIGGNVGQSLATIDNDRIMSAILSNGYTVSSIANDDRDTGYKIYGGYQLNRNFAVEGGYFDLGKFSFSSLPAGTLSGNIKIRGLNLDLVGTLPLSEKFSVFGRIGANYAEATDSFSGPGAVALASTSPSNRDTNLKVGLGVQYAFTESFALRAEMERYRINDAVGNKGDIDLVSIGLIYRFGAKTPAPAPRAVMSEPVPVAAAPRTVFVPPAPPPPMPTKVTFSSDSLFDFDHAGVKPEGKQALDKFASDLQGVNYDIITVTGHTDRIGSPAYNQKLSTRRAEAVSTYLVESAGIPASKITAKGVDGSEPVTKPGDCVGKKVSKKLIACLQPDRRVEVEVTGSK